MRNGKAKEEGREKGLNGRGKGGERSHGRNVVREKPRIDRIPESELNNMSKLTRRRRGRDRTKEGLKKGEESGEKESDE